MLWEQGVGPWVLGNCQGNPTPHGAGSTTRRRQKQGLKTSKATPISGCPLPVQRIGARLRVSGEHQAPHALQRPLPGTGSSLGPVLQWSQCHHLSMLSPLAELSALPLTP